VVNSANPHADTTLPSTDPTGAATPGLAGYRNPTAPASWAQIDNGRARLSGAVRSSEAAGPVNTPPYGPLPLYETPLSVPVLNPRTFDRPIPEFGPFRLGRKNTTMNLPEGARVQHYSWNRGLTAVIGRIVKSGDQTLGSQRAYTAGAAPLFRPQPADSWAERYTRAANQSPTASTGR
jgi:hypothetical protein